MSHGSMRPTVSIASTKSQSVDGLMGGRPTNSITELVDFRHSRWLTSAHDRQSIVWKMTDDDID